MPKVNKQKACSMSDHDDYTRHEALHMSLFLAESIESQIIDNGFIQSDKECLELANKANKALLDLYQLIGRKHLSE